jgi:hypothetical protein
MGTVIVGTLCSHEDPGFQRAARIDREDARGSSDEGRATSLRGAFLSYDKIASYAEMDEIISGRARDVRKYRSRSERYSHGTE